MSTITKAGFLPDVKAIPLKPKDPADMNRGEFEAWAALRGRGVYDVYGDRMMFRCRNAVYQVEMPLRFETRYIDGIVYAMTEDIIKYGRLR